MIEFISIDNPHKSNEYDKGILFEQLVKKLVDSCGYNNIVMRRKMNSLEYDITATSKIGKRELIGEAKAFDRKISGEFTQFVGKMLLSWDENPTTLGVFISISPLTADVNDYALKVAENHSMEIIAGSEKILEYLAKHCGYPTLQAIRDKATTEFELVAGECIFVITDRGEYFVQLLMEPSLTIPTFFAVYNNLGNHITDNEFYRVLKESSIPLRDLKPLVGKNVTHHEVNIDYRGFLSITTGKGWFDYKLPAPPECFVGREQIIDKVNDYIIEVSENKTGVRVFEILSRSGVGKSSLSIKIAQEQERKGNICQVIDSRGLESPIQVLGALDAFCERVCKRLGKEVYPIRTINDITTSMLSTSILLEKNGCMGLIIFDQFESLFTRPSMYTEVVDNIVDILHVSDRIIFGIARKNDQFATYDESSRIDLTRITSISYPFLLEDFTLPEAEALIKNIKVETGRALSKDLHAFVLEFTNGFPWLLKRICAHIIDLVKSGKSPQEIIDAAFQLQDLFDEELSALDEPTKDFLLRGVYYLPATVDDLSEIFSGDTRLQEYLTTLQHHRIIRLTGRTYDTYNDVLKEYLKTGRVSINVRYIPRMTAKATLAFLEEIYYNKWKDIEVISKEKERSVKVLFNSLRELKELGLIIYRRGQITVSESAERCLKHGNLVDLLKTTMKQNTLVRDILRVLAERKTLNSEEMIEAMKKAMPFTTASDAIWESYANTLGTWLKAAELAYMKDGILYQWNSTHPTQFEIEALPTSYIQHVTKLLNLLSIKDMTVKELCTKLSRSTVQPVCKDSILLGLVEATNEGFSLTKDGRLYATSPLNVKQKILSDKVLTVESTRKVIDLMKSSSLTFDQAFEQAFADRRSEWTTSTEEWRKKLSYVFING